MKLHLPVKLRASLIAAVIAVSASVYNAYAAGTNYVAPSNDYGWDTNDITLPERYINSAGNTYTADSTTYDTYEMYEGTKQRVGYLLDDEGNFVKVGGQYVRLDWDGVTYNHEGQPVETTKVDFLPTDKLTDEAKIIISAAATTNNRYISYINGDTTLTTNGAVEIENSLASGAANLEGADASMGYKGNLNVETNNIKITDKSHSTGSEVVMEDVNITAVAPAAATKTSIEEGSRLVILDGDDTYTARDKDVLNMTGVPFSEGVDRTQDRTVVLGDVSGGGSLLVVGNKERTEDAADGTRGYENGAVDKTGNLTTKITSLNGLAEVGFAGVDNVVEGAALNLTTITLVNSVTTVEGKDTAGNSVTTKGIGVNAESVLTAAGTISNINNAGSGHADIRGKVESLEGNVQLNNGKGPDYGIQSGATVIANQGITLNSVDADAAKKIEATEGSLRLFSNSVVKNTTDISAGADLIIEADSHLIDSNAVVGGNVVVTDQKYTTNLDTPSSVEGSTITVKEPGDSIIEISNDSSLTDSTITVEREDASTGITTVEITNGSTMTDSYIMGANGDILVSGDDAQVGISEDSEGSVDFINTTDEEGNVVRKGNLDAVLALADEEALLTKEGLESIEGVKVGSMIGNSTGNVTIKNADVTSTVVTAGGSVALGEDDGSGAPIVAEITTPAEGATIFDAAKENIDSFNTVVKGDIIDVRGNKGTATENDNKLTIESAGVADTIILGITSEVSIKDSLLDNNYIDGGTSIDLDNSVIIDTDIVNLTGDIKISNGNVLASEEDKPFHMSTQGTLDALDKDNYTGGSIILENTNLSNGIITSGKDIADTETDAKKGEDSLGVKLPYGEITVTDSNLTDMEISTNKGNISLTGSTAPSKTPTTPIEPNNNAKEISGFTTTLAALGVEGTSPTTVLNITVAERKGNNANTSYTGDVSLRIKDSSNNVVATSTNTVNFGTNGTIHDFAFSGLSLDPTATYTFEFVKEDGTLAKVDLALYANGPVSPSPVFGHSNWSAIVSVSMPTNTVTDSTITTGEGDITITKTTVADSSIASEGEGGIVITDSALTNSDITSADGHETNGAIITGSSLQDVTVETGKGGIVISDSSVSTTDITSTEGHETNGAIITDSTLDEVTISTGKGSIVITDSTVSDTTIDSEEGHETIGITVHGSEVSDSEISTGSGNILVEASSTVSDSQLSTETGSINIQNSTVQATGDRYDEEGNHISTITSEENGTLLVQGSTITKSAISAEGVAYDTDGTTVLSETSKIGNSTVTDSDIELWGEGADLEIGMAMASHVRGQSNLTVDDTITVKTNSTIDMNGGAEDRNASITADKLHIESVAGDHAKLTNGQIAIGTETVITGTADDAGRWLDLTDVNTAEAEGAGTLGDLIEKSGNAGVNIVHSNVEIGEIYSQDSEDKLSIDHYLKYVNVGKDSTVKVTGDAFVNEYREAHKDDHRDTAGKGSTVTFEKNASLKDAYIWGTGNDSTAQGKFDTQTIVNGEAHIGHLNLSHEGVLSIINATEAVEGKGTLETPVTDTKSYISNIGKADPATGQVHGVLNVVGGTLTTPKLDQGQWMTVGLNGGIIELGSVTAEQGATVASEAAVNPHVNVRAITDAAITGVTDTIGESTIRTTLNRVVTPYSYNEGTETEVTAHTYYYVAIADGTLTDGTVVTAGDIITRTDAELTYFTKADGSTVADGVTVDVIGATQLDENDRSLLTRVTELMLTEDGDLRTEIAANGTLVVIAGQVYTESTLTYFDGVAEEIGSIEEVTDGIASLTVKNDFSANKTTIKAYETGTADETTGVVTPDANTGFIKIQGDLSGSEDTLIADNDITIGSMTGEENTIISNRGDVTIGDIGTEEVSSDNNTIAGVNVTTGDITGSENDVTAAESITTGDITGDSNELTAGTTITTEDITGDSNVLGALESIETGDITGDSNELTAGTTITTGDIEGDSNVLDALESIETDNITGDSNELTAGTTITTEDITGDSNELTAGESIVTEDITGNENELTAGESIETGIITGDDNVLTATGVDVETEDGEIITVGGTIVTDDIVGDSNELTANESIETGDIAGDENVLLAGTTITTGDIDGNNNELTAGESIETGDITGNENMLTAGTTITTGAIDGDGNMLDAVEDITIDGDVTGDTNSIVSHEGDIAVAGTIDGDSNVVSAEQGDLSIGGIDGSNTTAGAQGTIEIGSLSGEYQNVLAYANGLSQDDVAIHIGEFNAEGTIVGIATTTSEVYGYASGNGSIVIDTMTAVEGEGPDLEMLSIIKSNNSFVHIGAMQDSNARTQITAAKDVIVGSAFTFGLGADTGANLTIAGQNLQVNSTGGLELTDSTVAVINDITGTALTLTTTTDTKFISSADKVKLDSLTLGGSAILRANEVTLGTLTIDGTKATLDSSDVEATAIVLKNGAVLDAKRVGATELTVEDSTFAFSSLDGIQKLTVDNSQGSISQALTGLTGDVQVLNGSTLAMQAPLATDGKITVSGGSTLTGATTVKGKDSIEVNDGTLQAVTIATEGALTATDGNVNATSTINAASLTADGSNVTATNGITLAGGDLTATNSSTIGANVTGAKDVTITDSTAQNIAMTGDLTTDTAEIGKVTGAQNVSLTDTTAGAIAMNGTLTADNATTGKVTGTVTTADITNGSDINSSITTTGAAMVSDSAIHGALTATGNATVTNSTIDGAVSGATTSITGGSAASATATTGTVTTDGATIAGAVTGATGATVNGGQTGDVTATTGDATITGAQVGNVLASKGTATVTDTTAGTISAKDATVTGGTADSITATGAATVTGTEVAGTITGGTTTVKGGSAASAIATTGTVSTENAAIAGAVTGATGATVNGGSTGNVTATTGDATITGAQVGNVLASKGTATVTDTTAGSISAKDAVVSGGSADSITATGAATVTGTEVVGTITGGTTTVKGGSAASAIATTGTVSTENAAIAGAVTGATGATVNGGSTGNVTATTGDATITGAQVGNVLASKGTATVTDTTAGSISAKDAVVSGGTADSITATGAATVTGTEVAGTITGGTTTVKGGSAASAIATTGTVSTEGAAISGEVKGQTGATVNGGSTGDVTATTGDATITGAQVGNVLASNGTATVTDTTAGTINAKDAEVTGSATGAITATTATVADSTTGAITADTLAVTDSTTGDISATTATLTDTNTGAIKTTGALTTNGNVNADGNVTVGGDLAVNAGTLNAGDNDVKVSGKTTLNAGEVVAADFTTNGIELIGVDAIVDSLTSQDDIVLNGGSLTSDGAVTTEGAMNLTDGASVSAGSVSVKDGLTVDSSSLDAETIAMNGTDLSVLDGATVTGDVAGAKDVTVNKGDITGTVAATGALSVTEGSIDAVTGTVSSATVDNGTIGSSLTTSGAADIDNSTIKGDLSAATADVQGSTVNGSVATTGDVTVGSDSKTGNVTSTAGNATIDNATVGNVAANNGTATVTDTTAGTISAKDAVVSGGSSSSIAATDSATVTKTTTGTINAKDAEVTDSTTGAITTSDSAKVTDSTINGAIAATGDATVSGSTVTGDVTGANTSITGGSAASATATTGTVTTTGADIAGSVTGATGATVNGGTTGDVIATTGDATIGNATVGNVTANNGTAKLDGAIAGTVNAKDADITGGETGSVTTSDSAKVTDSTINGAIAATGDATVSGSTVTGDVTGANTSITGGSAASATATTGTVTTTGADIAGSVTGATGATVNGGTTGDVIATTGDATIGNATVGNVTANNGTAALTETTAGTVNAKDADITGGSAASVDAADKATLNGAAIAGAVNATDVEMTNGSADSIKATAGATLKAATVKGMLEAGEATITGGSTGDVIATTGDATIGNATVGNVTANNGTAALTETTAGTVNAKDADITGGTTGSVKATAGATLKDATVNGTVEAGVASITGGSTGDVTATTGDATISGGAEVGNVSAANGTVDVTNSIVGDVTAQEALVTGGTAGDVIATTGDATISGGAETGDVTAANGTVDVTGSTVGAVNGKNAQLTDATADSVTADELAAATGSTVLGTVKGADAMVAGGTTGDVIATTGDATISGGAQVGDVTAAHGSVDATDSTLGVVNAKTATVSGGSAVSITAAETATTENAVVDGTVKGADVAVNGGKTGDVIATTGDASISNAEVGDVTANGGTVKVTKGITGEVSAQNVALADAKTGAVTATKNTTIESNSTVDSLDTKGMKVTNGAALLSNGAVAANGALDVQGDVTATTVEMTGAAGSSISGADVTATAGPVVLKGTIAAKAATLKGTEVKVDGTVNAGKDTAIDGTLVGKGTINKTGGDTLAIEKANGSVNINVKDASTLQLADGTKVGKVDASAVGAKLIIGEEESVDRITVAGLKLSSANTLTLDTDLDTAKADRVNGPADLNGATLKLATVGDERKIADQTRIRVFDSVSSAANEDVLHNMKTLNAYADGNSIVLSKNYRGAEDLTKNQKSTAAALADLQDSMTPTGELADVFDALSHTRSEADAKAALESLSGAGLATISKMVTDDAHDHLQTLRGTMKSLAAGVTSRFDENGHRIEGLNSSAISAVATGGTTRISSDGNAAAYSRNSWGVQLAGVHALSREWTGAISAAYSSASGDCGPVDVDSQGLYLDVAVMHKGYRVTQTASLGCGHFDVDTERMVNVKAAGHDYSGKAEGSTSAMAVTLSYEAVASILTNEDKTQDLAAVFQADIVHAQFDSFSETGLGNAGLISEIDDVTSATFGIGARYTANFGQASNPGYFMAEALFVADAGDREAKINNRFIGGGQSFELNGPDAGACGLRLNAGVLVPVSEQVGIFGNVSSEFRAHQTSVSGGVGVKVAF